MNRLNNWFIAISHLDENIIYSDYICSSLRDSDGTPNGDGYGCGHNANDAKGHGHYYMNTFKGFNYGCGIGSNPGFSDGSSY